MAYQTKFRGNTAVISGIEHFDPEVMLFCGQAFRWRKQGADTYRGIAHGRVVDLSAKNGELKLHPVTREEFEGIWEHYFDLKRDYAALQESYGADPILIKAMAFAGGMRVLNQQPFETLVSFILSANNNVKRITGIIERLCACFGKEIEHEGVVYNTFPEPEALSRLPVAGIASCGAGYRAPYVAAAAKAVCEGFDLDALKKMDYDAAKKELVSIKGVGGKVADCILLYSLGFSEAFPMDVWIQRVVYDLYGFCGKGERELREFICGKFGGSAGIAQQYLFHYARKNNIAAKPVKKSTADLHPGRNSKKKTLTK